ncbi:MAG: TonB family protein [Acidobacteria bacterium]|nr:TonB family protein [Acidobacteriota bacterium]
MSFETESGPSFTSLEGQSRSQGLTRLCAGFIANALILALLVWVKVPSSERPLVAPRIQMLSLNRLPEPVQLPAVVKPMRRPAPKAKILDAPKPDMARSLELPAPPSITPTPVEMKAALPKIEAAAIPAPKPVLGTFSSAAPAPARVERESARVTTGGFGASAATTEPKPAARPAMAQQSGFEGAESARPAKARVELTQSDAFGSSVPSAPKLRSSATMMATAFDASPATSRRNREARLEAEIKGVEILSKPRPMYTEEARRLGIEGEVQLRILFGADGRLKVLAVVRGLGHGLDENAALAAAQIQFRPATRQGQPVEQAAVVRVQFQLAN